MPSRPPSENPAGIGPLLLVDGHCYAYRAFYAIANLTSPTGRPVNAIYGFIRVLDKMRQRIQPSRMAVVWDSGLAAARMTLLPEYKAHRPDLPSNLAMQLDDMVAYLGAAGICSVRVDGTEADDCIATLAVEAAAAGSETVIASSDKDFMQLVSPKVRLLVPHDKTEALWDATQVKTKTGVEPAQIVDYLSLIGDSVDNIPGVEGVGPKTAADLLGKFGSVDVIYQNLSEIGSERLRGRLQAAEEAVRRNQQLIRLDTSCPCAGAKMDMGACNPETLRSLYTGWGFKKMLQALDELHARHDELFHEQSHAA